ncbi:hypothetical protein [Roseiflexus sp.]|uniref:hypothetical protein n=1 Tax=Roseiflexus sp. TaxID=2562120 RepID=UPI00398AC5FD
MIKSAPTLILMAMSEEPEPGVEGVAAVDAIIVSCGISVGVTEGEAEGVSSVRYGSRDPTTTNDAAVGKPPGIHAGRWSYERRVTVGVMLARVLTVPSDDGNAVILDAPPPAAACPGCVVRVGEGVRVAVDVLVGDDVRVGEGVRVAVGVLVGDDVRVAVDSAIAVGS